ncbi:MAG: GerMN domain-containing protein [Leptolyngbyaceae cyanobacterium bins.59]|nr:GerMN domain-containing protein [Leptolyngbyaceae cyanobacterium bins.59]
MDQRPSSRLPLIIVTLSAAAAVIGGGVAWVNWQQSNSTGQVSQPTTAFSPTQPPAVSPVPISPSTEKTVQVYWLKASDTQVELASSPVKISASSKQSATDIKLALERLLEGPANSTLTTTIPQGTKLRSVSVKADGIHVDLSQDFVSGGGTTSMSARLAQILYTATGSQPDAKVWIAVEGKPLEVLGGEGIVVNQPLTRKVFERDYAL